MRAPKEYVQLGLLGEAIDLAPAIVLVADENGDYLAVNGHACEAFGYARDEFIRLNVRDVVAEPDVYAHYVRFTETGFESGVVTARRKDGSTFRFRYRAGPTTIGVLAYYVSVGWAE